MNTSAQLHDKTLTLPTEEEMLVAGFALDEDSQNRYIHIPTAFIWKVCFGRYQNARDLGLATRHFLTTFGINPDKPFDSTQMPGVTIYRQHKSEGVAEYDAAHRHLARKVLTHLDLDVTDDNVAAAVEMFGDLKREITEQGDGR